MASARVAQRPVMVGTRHANSMACARPESGKVCLNVLLLEASSTFCQYRFFDGNFNNGAAPHANQFASNALFSGVVTIQADKFYSERPYRSTP